jgi:hypothetical protein
MTRRTSASITPFSPRLTSPGDGAPPPHRSSRSSATQSADNPLKLLRERSRSPSLASTIATDAGLAAPTLKGEIPKRPQIPPQQSALAPGLRDLRCAGRASQTPIAPADRGAPIPRFPSLAAFERRPSGLGACGKLSERAGIPKPVTLSDVSSRSKVCEQKRPVR